MISCVNQRYGCENSVSKGSILCEECKEKRKTLSRQKRDQDFDNILKRQHEIQCELQTKLDIAITENKTMKNIIDDYKTKLENNHTVISYDPQLAKENSRLLDLIAKQREENENLLKEKSEYEMTHSQLKLDNEKLLSDIDRLNQLIDSLNVLVKSLTDENEMLYKISKMEKIHESVSS